MPEFSYAREELENRKLSGYEFSDSQKEQINLRFPGFFDDKTNSLTNVSNVIEDKEQKDKTSQEIDSTLNKLREEKSKQYTRILGVDPYLNPTAGFNAWYNKVKNDNEAMSKFINSSPGEIEDNFYKNLNEHSLEKLPGMEEDLAPSLLPATGVEYAKKIQREGKSLTDARTYVDVAERVHGRYDPIRIKVTAYLEDPSEQNAKDLNEVYSNLKYIQIDRGEQVFTYRDALDDITKNPWKYIPFGGYKEGYDLYKIFDLSKRFNEDPGKLADNEIEILRNFIEYNSFKENQTWAAGVVEIITQMPAFWAEIAVSGATVTVAKKTLKKSILKNVNDLAAKGIESKIKKEAVRRGIKK